MWASLRENTSCGNKLSDVICHPQMPTKQRRRRLEKEAQHNKIDVHVGNSIVVNKASYKQCASPRSFEGTRLCYGHSGRRVLGPDLVLLFGGGGRLNLDSSPCFVV